MKHDKFERLKLRRTTECLVEAIKQIIKLESSLASCAAGPWCYDIDKAPKDGTWVLLLIRDTDGTLSVRHSAWAFESWIGVWKSFEVIAFSETRIPSEPSIKEHGGL